ncbi:CAP domain-containing protein [Lachnospiraceae bacterium OttesenSCG-928-D06]|nr:CAP domain-containing protein [Lachnospiraceae bacterium OttesenSCG-928-D06]
MKKLSIAAITAFTLAGTLMAPLTVEAATCQKGQGNKNIIAIKGNDMNDLINQLNQMGVSLNPQDCFPNRTPVNPCVPETPTRPETPVSPETPTKPETPAIPETPVSPETPTNPEAPKEEVDSLSYAEQVVKLVNEEREKAGLSPVVLDESIESAALVRAKETEKSFSHTRPNGQSFSTALKEAGVNYRGAGENIAMGQKTPEEVMEGWMNSTGHRANILSKNYTKIGVGYYQNARGTSYWTQLFVY